MSNTDNRSTVGQLGAKVDHWQEKDSKCTLLMKRRDLDNATRHLESLKFPAFIWIDGKYKATTVSPFQMIKRWQSSIKDWTGMPLWADRSNGDICFLDDAKFDEFRRRLIAPPRPSRPVGFVLARRGGSKRSHHKSRHHHNKRDDGHRPNETVWTQALRQARKELGIHGFYPIRSGSRLHRRALEIKRRLERQ